LFFSVELVRSFGILFSVHFYNYNIANLIFVMNDFNLL
jgi:hypothetical protein